MTSTPPQKEYIITEDQLRIMVGKKGINNKINAVAVEIYSRPAPLPQTCKKYWNYRADSGHLYHLIYDLTGKMPTEDTLGDLLMEVRDNDTITRNATLDDFARWVKTEWVQESIKNYKEESLRGEP